MTGILLARYKQEKLANLQANTRLTFPLEEEIETKLPIRQEVSNNNKNKLFDEDRAVHDWFRFVLSFPPHIVRNYLEDWGIDECKRVLDPFCGTGTTVIQCKMHGIPSIGIEANPMAHFASATKTDWGIAPKELLRTAEEIMEAAQAQIGHEALCFRTLPPDAEDLLLTDSISPLPLHKVLVLRECIERKADRSRLPHLWLALAKIAVGTASNLKFGPEVGIGAKKKDAPVLEAWYETVKAIADDIEPLRGLSVVPAVMIHADARQARQRISDGSIDAVFTSPPYPNEKDYSRTTRLETVLLGFANNKKELRQIKKGLLRSNTRGVYKEDDDDYWVKDFPVVQELANTIEKRRIELGKTSGFERLYGRVTKLYFGGMARHLSDIRPLLRPGARLGYVVGDQASYLRVMIRTGEVLAEIAVSLGYEVVSIDLFRTRLATATKEMMKEEVVILEWPGMQ